MYESQIVRLVADSKEAKAANDRRDLQTAAVKTAAAQQAADSAEAKEAALGSLAQNPQPSHPGSEATEVAEQEPNDTIFEANATFVGQTITGEIAKTGDVDFFKLHYDGKLRDRLNKKLQNQLSRGSSAVSTVPRSIDLLHALTAENDAYRNLAGGQSSVKSACSLFEQLIAARSARVNVINKVDDRQGDNGRRDDDQRNDFCIPAFAGTSLRRADLGRAGWDTLFSDIARPAFLGGVSHG